MTDTLLRISCADTGDFSKLMLAPGLAMLDQKMLTYQVLHGWLHDLLAEPQLDGDSVIFHVQVGGERQRVRSRGFATDADLAGPLANDFERLRKALFEIKPVSPSERLIFSRLQPPVGSHDGYLFKVQTEDEVERLVWCWGYQRRVSDGPLALCPNATCSALIVKQGGQAETCPHCHEPLERPVAMAKVTPRKRSRPFGALIASSVLLLAAGGTYFYAATARRDVPSDHELLSTLETRPLGAAERAPQQTTVDIDEPDLPPLSSNSSQAPAKAPRSQSMAKKNDLDRYAVRNLLDGPSPANSVDNRNGGTNRSSDSENGSSRNTVDSTDDFRPTRIPARKPAPSSQSNRDDAKASVKPEKIAANPVEPQQLPLIVINPRSNSSDNEPFKISEPTAIKPTVPNLVTDTGSEAANSKSKPDPKALVSIQPPTLTLPLESEPSKADSTSKSSSSSGESNKEPVRLQTSLEGANNDPPTTQIPRKKVGDLQWHQDYLAGYQQAIQDKRLLMMLFHDVSGPDHSATRTSGFGAENLQPLLENFVRVSLPVGALTPSAEPNAPATRLIEHRSFRHLKSQAGIAIVDLTDEKSANYGRVVSALPLPSDGRYSPEILETLLQLPSGSIGQRSLVLAVRTGVDGDNFTSGEPTLQLHQFANRSARLMAQAERASAFDADVRATAIRELLGEGIRIGELHFATEGAVGVQEAAIQAVSHWLKSSEDRKVLQQASFAYGIELFQSPSSQRWFATCIVLSR